MALDALEQVAALSQYRKVDRTRSIAVCLAYLASLQDCERWPFDDFWKWMAAEDAIIRSANVSRALNAIYLAVGIERETKRVSRAQRSAQEVRKVPG